MNGGTPLIDKLLATPSMQRSDLVPLKGQLALLQPDAITDIEASANDTRLPSRAAMDRQLGVDPASPLQPGGALQAATGERGATLSPAARVISEILGAAPARVDAVRGSAPLWSAATSPAPSQLAAALLQAVSDSGLFYESHLLQFANGERSLAQLAQEPQAALGQAVAQRSAGLPDAAPSGGPASPADESAVSAVIPGVTSGKVALPIQAGLPPAAPSFPASASEPGAEAPTARSPVATAPWHGDVGDDVGAAPESTRGPAGVIDVAAAYRAAGSPDNAAAPGLSQHLASPSSTPRLVPAPSTAVTTGMVHPDAVPLVRQQLELMALSQFRWSGEAWPEAKTTWEIQEHDRRQESGDDADAAPRRWSTRLTMTLPRLGNIELRLSVLGDSWHAHLAAAEEDSLSSMRAASAQLRHRFDAAGIHLSELQLQKVSVSTADNMAPGKNNDTV